MIPTIGLMIGCYIVFRCFEASCRAKESFAGAAARSFIIVAACLCIAVVGFCTADLVLSASTVGLGR